MSNGLIVSEVFGPTLQGEGPSIGRPAMFVRLGICNLSCTWCDTKYTWDWRNYDPKKELVRLQPANIVNELSHLLKGKDLPTLVITGGEPLLQQQKVAELVYYVRRTFGYGSRIEVETSGSITPVKHPDLRDSDIGPLHFNVSPKLYHSGNSLARRYNPDALRAFSRLACFDKASFKFVVQRPSDLEEIEKDFVKPFEIPSEAIYCMPEGLNIGQVQYSTHQVAQGIIDRGWNLTTRLHIFLWGDKRGV